MSAWPNAPAGSGANNYKWGNWTLVVLAGAL